MTTKAELEAELAELRQQMDEDPDASEAEAEADTGQEAQPEVDSDGTGHPALDRILHDHGISPEEIRGLMDQFNKELGHLPQSKPLLTALGAFALGFALGRMSK